jgi:hypothetical protein
LLLGSIIKGVVEKNRSTNFSNSIKGRKLTGRGYLIPLVPHAISLSIKLYILNYEMSLDDDELAYLWTKVKFVQKYMSKNENSTLENAEREFHNFINGLLDSRIERVNKMLNAKPQSYELS